MPKPAARRAHARNVAVAVAARPASVHFPAWATNAVGTVSESFFLSPLPSAAEGTGGHIVAVLFPGVGVADDFTEGRAKAAPSGAASLPKRGLWRAGWRRRACRLNRMFVIIIYPARGPWRCLRWAVRILCGRWPPRFCFPPKRHQKISVSHAFVGAVLLARGWEWTCICRRLILSSCQESPPFHR